MQSWGLRSRFIVRDTAREPTKSGVVGLLAAALGVARDDRGGIARLAALRMGVRVDREGILEQDYHVTQNVPTTAGTGHRTIVSRRYYLADAVFLVVLEGDSDLLEQLYHAVQQPRWPLFLGRKAFVPTRPLVGGPGGAGLFDGSLEEALRTHPWLELEERTRREQRQKIDKGTAVALRTVVDCDPHEGELRYDYPVSFVRREREFAPRWVRVDYVPLTSEMIPGD